METNVKNEKEKELDINEVAIKLDVDAEVIEKVRRDIPAPCTSG